MQNPSPKSQYHHFIPRFILRNFVHPQTIKANKRKKHRGRKYNEPVVYAVDLSGPTAEIIESPVSSTFGMKDMYRDFANAINQHYLEKELSKLESRAGETVSRIRKHFEEGKSEVWITRPNRDTLRKFLFIMMYRNCNMRKRFYYQDKKGYCSNDKKRLLLYMDKKGFEKPIDVWFDNIKGMLELDMDSKLNWMTKLCERIYPDDAQWFIAHTQMMFLAFCTPADKDDEFLLTENVYGIHEGPTSYKKDPNTGQIADGPYTEYHKFAALSPKLMLVLRSVMLPVPEEDSNDRIKKWRETFHNLNVCQHNHPDAAKSILADLPITKARNSYSEIVDGVVTLLNGEDGSFRADHKFCFRFFPLMTNHVNKINAILLENSSSTSAIVFKSHTGFQRAAEYFLRLPARGFKLCGNAPDDPRLLFLKKLEQLLKRLGSDTTAVYQMMPGKFNLGAEEELFANMLEESLPKKPTEFMQLYSTLGGSYKTLSGDMDQARRMVNMRIKVDVITKGLDEDFREGVRDNVRDLFCRLPPRRVWLYLKQIRNMLLGGHNVALNEKAKSKVGDLIDGPEDAIARASQLFRNNIALCRIMWFSTLSHIQIIQNPNINLDTDITLDEAGFIRLQRQRHFAFNPAGCICDCGIPKVEEKARFCKDMVRKTRCFKEYKNPFWTLEENVEMVTRSMVRSEFLELIDKKLSSEDSKALEGTLFDIIYPVKR